MTTTEISILGKKIHFEMETRNIFDLKFYKKNPRVLSTLYSSRKLDAAVDANEEQDIIFKCLQSEQSVKSLIDSIRKHKGINEPIIVQASTSTVLEGNSRLAALRLLAQRDGTDLYTTVACRVIDVDQSEIDSLLSLQHIEGKTAWSAFSKAYICYHRVEVDGVSIEQYADNTNVTTSKVNTLIDIIKLMKAEGAEEQQARFSHYEQIVKSRKLNECMQTHKGLKRFLLDNLKKSDDELLDARDLRDGVSQIAKKPKLLGRWMDGKIDYQEALTDSRISQPKQHLSTALKNLRQIERTDVERLESNERNALKIEVKKCIKEVNRIQSIVKDT